LLREIDGLSSADEAALWAQRRLVAKNQLSEADAQQVEEAFATKLGFIPAENAKAGQATATLKESLAEKPPQIDKSLLEFPEPRRIHDRDHIRHVMTQPCLICGRRPSDPHHLRFAQSRALGRKVSDEFTVPLCRTITVKSIAAAMKNRGGRTVEQIRLQRLARSGLKPTRYRDGKLLLGTMRPRPTRRQMTDVWSGLLFSFLPHARRTLA
jgi:hypothetical protein